MGNHRFAKYLEAEVMGECMQKDSLSRGVYAAALTPLHSDLSCHWEKLSAHCADLIGRGCQGVALFGTTGEGPSFSSSEKIEVLKQVVSSGFDAGKIFLGNGSSGIFDTVDLIRASVEFGCAALLLCPPCFYKDVKEEGVIAYYREIIRKSGETNFKIILYHIPQLSGVPITLKIAETLKAEFPEIVIGLKESEGNLPFTKALLDRLPAFQVFVGNERQIPEAVRYGASGSICGIANLDPELICSLYERGSDEDLREIDEIFSAVKGVPFIPAAKAILEERYGAVWHTVRPPLIPLNAEEREKLSMARVLRRQK